MNKKPSVIVNAVIEAATIKIERGFILDSWIHLNYGGSGQGYGGFVIGGTPDTGAGNHMSGGNYAGEWIVRCMLAADVEDWEKMKGRTVRVRKTDEFGDIIEIGHIVRDDRWFNAKEIFASWKAAKAK